MAKATIKSQTGALITIVGSDKEVSNILSILETSATLGRAREVAAKTHANNKDRKKRGAASDLVIGLRERGFFDKPKGLSEISKALEEEGFIYPVTTLSGVVLGLVQKKLLGRKKKEGRWAYGK